MESIWRLGPNFSPTLGGSPGPNKLGPAQPEPILRTQCDTLGTCILLLFPSFFGFDAGSCEAMLLTLGLSLAELRRQMPQHSTKLHMLGPTCLQTCPSCAMLDLSWAQVGPKIEPTVSSSAQVTPKLGPSGLLFGATQSQGRPSLTPVGAKYITKRNVVPWFPGSSIR